MSIERAVHHRWESYKPLTDLVPAHRITTAWLPSNLDGEIALPYCSLRRGDEAEVLTPSGGKTLTRVPLTVTIHSESLTDAKRIRDRVQDRFDDATYDYAEGKVVIMRRVGATEERNDDGTWLMTVTYDTLTEV